MGAPIDVELGGLVLGIDFLDILEELGALVPLPFVPAAVSIVEDAEGINHAWVGFVVVVVEDFVYADGLGLAFHDHIVHLPGPVGGLDRLEGEFTDQDVGAVLFAGTFDAGGQIHAVADHGVVHALGRTDVAGNDGVGVDAHAVIDGQLAFSCALVVVDLQIGHHTDGCPHGPVGIVVVGDGRAEDAHHGIADELVEHAAFVGDTVDHNGEVLVEEFHRALGSKLFGNCGEAANVGKEDEVYHVPLYGSRIGRSAYGRWRQR